MTAERLVTAVLIATLAACAEAPGPTETPDPGEAPPPIPPADAARGPGHGGSDGPPVHSSEGGNEPAAPGVGDASRLEGPGTVVGTVDAAPDATGPLPPPPPTGTDPGTSPSGRYQAEEVPGSPSFQGTGVVWWGDRLIIADRGKKALFEHVPPATFRELPGLELQDPTGVAIDGRGNLLVSDCGPCLGDRERPTRIVRLGRDGRREVILQTDVPIQDLVAHDGGMMYWGGFDHGVVRAGAPGSAVQALSPSIGHSYGVALSPRQDVLYASSKLPGTRRLFRFPLNPDGQPGTGELVVAIDATSPEGKALGRIQGITVDALGNVYMVGAESQVDPAVVVVSPAQKAVIALVRGIPGNRADVAFGDADLRTLYVTGAGKLYRARLPVPGTAQ